MPWMWAGELLTVSCVVCLLIPKLRRKESVLAVLCVGVIAAIWIEKGLAMITTGFIPSPLGQVTEYAPTGYEVAISLGVYGIGFFVLTVLYRVALNIRERLEPAG